MIPALEAINELLRPQELRLNEGDRRTIKGPCLLAQLQAAIAAGTGSRGGTSKPSSRPPIATDALDLWIDIQTHAHGLANALDVPRHDTNPSSPIPHVGRLLRTATATAHGRGWYAAVDRVELKARSWREQIDGMLSGQHHERPLRGAHCPTCSSTTVLEQREDGTYRVPALVLITRDYLAERWLVCQACGQNQAMADHVLDALFPDDEDDAPEADQLDEALVNAA